MIWRRNTDDTVMRDEYGLLFRFAQKSGTWMTGIGGMNMDCFFASLKREGNTDDRDWRDENGLLFRFAQKE